MTNNEKIQIKTLKRHTSCYKSIRYFPNNAYVVTKDNITHRFETSLGTNTPSWKSQLIVLQSINTLLNKKNCVLVETELNYMTITVRK